MNNPAPIALHPLVSRMCAALQVDAHGAVSMTEETFLGTMKGARALSNADRDPVAAQMLATANTMKKGGAVFPLNLLAQWGLILVELLGEAAAKNMLPQLADAQTLSRLGMDRSVMPVTSAKDGKDGTSPFQVQMQRLAKPPKK